MCNDFNEVKEQGCDYPVCLDVGSMFYDEKESEEMSDACRLEVINVVKFSDFMVPAIGRFMDDYFEKEGWELQYVKGDCGCTGYQVFFGSGVQVDNNYEYGFPYLYDCDEVVAFAEYFYIHRSADKGTEDLQ